MSFQGWPCTGLICLLLLFMGGGCRDKTPAPHPPAGIDVQQYDLHLRLDPSTRMVEARAMLRVQHADSVTVLPLAFEGMTVDTVRVDEAAVAVNRQGGILLVPLSSASLSQVEVIYHGRPSHGLFSATYGRQQVVYTDSWPDEGRGWLPGIHHPADPATFVLDLTLPQGYEAVASGRLQAVDTLGADVCYHWRLDVPAPVYTFAFAVSDFSLTEDMVGDTLPVRYYMLAEDAALVDQLRRTPQALAFFSDLLGPYAYTGYAGVQIPMKFAGMENASTSFLDAELFETDQAEEVQIHELAHQWFGNRVPIADWSDLWLSEGTATYLTTLFYAHADGLDAARARWAVMSALSPLRQATHTALVADEPLSPEDYLTWVPYDKGASVLHLLRRKLGDDVFFSTLRRIYQRYAGRPLSTGAFRQELEREAGRSLDAFFAYWVYGSRLPVLETTWDRTAQTLTWKITGDDGTLADVPFEVQMRLGNHVQYVTVGEGRVVLPEGETQRPEVHPVGVMMQVKERAVVFLRHPSLIG